MPTADAVARYDCCPARAVPARGAGMGSLMTLFERRLSLVPDRWMIGVGFAFAPAPGTRTARNQDAVGHRQDRRRCSRPRRRVPIDAAGRASAVSARRRARTGIRATCGMGRPRLAFRSLTPLRLPSIRWRLRPRRDRSGLSRRAGAPSALRYRNVRASCSTRVGAG